MNAIAPSEARPGGAPTEAQRAQNPPLFADLPGDIEVSFEFFPPKTEKMAETLWQSLETLAPLRPRFVSVTYGAGGSTRERTHATVARIVAETGIPAAAHLTCVEASKADIAEVAEAYWAAGIRHIVALRGDPPVKDGAFQPFVAHPQGYTDAADLVAGLARLRPFELSVSAYPEVHPQATSAAADLAHLKRKLDAGASRAITQFFFEPDSFFRFRDRAAEAGISADLVPGILPVASFANVQRMSAQCGTNVPPWMARLFEGLDTHPDARQLVAATIAAEMVRRLYAGGVRHFHFYTLNRAELAYAICHMLGVRPK
jgi:methylenetetrahydrofolate reductase (NADPH)